MASDAAQALAAFQRDFPTAYTARDLRLAQTFLADYSDTAGTARARPVWVIRVTDIQRSGTLSDVPVLQDGLAVVDADNLSTLIMVTAKPDDCRPVQPH